MPSDEQQTMINLAYGLRTNRFFRIKTENNETRIEGADGADYPFLRWRGDITLPLSKSVAVEFNGIWEYDELHKRYNFIGEDKPYVFWVQEDGKLYCRLWDEEDTTFLLAENVVKCAVVRGWKNVNMWNHDQGLVCAYIKTDEKPYYRNYCKQPPNLEAVWEVERVIITVPSPVQNISVFRTNDYRTGFLCESAGKIYWTISEMDWAGMAVPREYLSAAPGIEIEFIAIEYPQAFTTEHISAAPLIEIAHLFAKTDNEIKKIMNVANDDGDWGWIIEFEVIHPIPALTLNEITTMDVDKNTPISIASVNKIDDYTFKLNVSNVVESGINNITGSIKIKISGVLNPAEKTYVDFEETFEPINLNPTFIPIPEVVSVWNE